MLRVYKKIDHKVFKVQDLVTFLVEEVFCKADKQRSITKLKANLTLEKLYNNKNSDWFKKQVDDIYIKSRELTLDERKTFIEIFTCNNNIENLCNNPSSRKSLDLLSYKISDTVIAFFKELYDRLLKWVDIESEYGSKKEYYNDLIDENDFKFCPCCGYGNIETVYDKGHSAFDHYLPVKHYPFSVINFYNLFPLCYQCNSGAKSSKDVLESNKKIFYPFNINHPSITFKMDIDSKSLIKFLEKVKKNDRPNSDDLKILPICDSACQEQVESWEEVYEIKQRYFGQAATFAISWMDDVREKQRKTKKTLTDCFDDIIEDDSNKHLGFLKSPFLKELKKYDSLIEAYEETRSSSIINH
jgi:hypothetical protein